MEAPDIIYLQTCGDCCNHELCPKECEECNFDDLAEVSWCKDKIFDTDRMYFSEKVVRTALASCLAFSDICDVNEITPLVEKVMSKIKELKGGKE